MPFFILWNSRKYVLFPPSPQMHVYTVVNLLIGLHFIKLGPSKEVIVSLGGRECSGKSTPPCSSSDVSRMGFLHPLTTIISKLLIHCSVVVLSIQKVLMEDCAHTLLLQVTPPLPNSGFNCSWMDRSLLADSFPPQVAPCDCLLICSWAFSKALETHPLRPFKKWWHVVPRITIASEGRVGQTNAPASLSAWRALSPMQCTFSQSLKRIWAPVAQGW